MRGYPIRGVANGRSGQFAGSQGLWSGRDGLVNTLNWVSAPGSLLPPGFSLTRASTGTYFDSAGLLQTAAIDAARGTYRYNGSSWVFDGTIVEAAATNILLYSYAHTTANWLTTGTTSLVANYYTGLSGSQNMDAIVVSAGGAAAQTAYQGSVTRSATTWVDSVDLKYDSHRWVCLVTFDATLGYKYASFDLLNGVTGAISASTTSGITPLGNGFYRCYISATYSATAGGQFIVCMNNSDTASFETWAPAGTTRVGFGVAQTELGSAPTSRITTTTAAVTRSADVVTATTSGLLVNAQGFCAVRGRVIAQNGAGPWIVLGSSAGASGVPLYYGNATSPAQLSTFDVTSVCAYGVSAQIPAIGGVFSAATTWSGTTFGGAQNGVLGTPSASFDGNMNLSATLQIGDGFGGSLPLSFVLQSLRLGTAPASAARLANLTV